MQDDLRRRALESGKTLSAKARSKQASRNSSRANSKANSRATSRVQSRDATDDEDEYGNGDLSDETTHSINSIDALLESDDFNEQTPDVMKQELVVVMDDLAERKGSSRQSREASLAKYCRCLTTHYLADTLYKRVPDLLTTFSRSIRTETTEKEASLALKAVSLTALSYEDDSLYENMTDVLHRSISDSQSFVIKAEAIHCLGDSISFGGADEQEILDTMEFLLDIISSDGNTIDAPDNGLVVAAACQVYTFLATQVDDLQSQSQEAIRILLDQLDAGDVSVQIATGQAIAFLFEKSYTEREEDEELSDEEEDEDESNADPNLIKRYDAFGNTTQILNKIKTISSASAKSINRKDRRELNQTMVSIEKTIANPKVGLQTHSSSKMTVRFHDAGEMRIDKWWKLIRLNAIRRVVGGGFVNHYFEGNKQILDALPLVLRPARAKGGLGDDNTWGNKVNKGKYRDKRRVIQAGEEE